MNFKYQAAIARALGKFVEKRARLQGQEAGPLVHPLPHGARRSRSRVRGARLAVDLRRVPAVAGRAPTSSAARIPALTGRDVSVLIWTTTPWTIPSNLAIAFHPEFDYARLRSRRPRVIVAEALAPKVAEAGGRAVRRAARAVQGRGAGAPRASCIRCTARDSLGVLGDYVTLDAGTGAVHTAPGHGADDFNTGVRYGLDIYAPVGPGGHFLDTVGHVRRAARVRREPERRAGAEGARRGSGTAQTFDAPVPALLALPQPGHLPGDVAVVHPHGRRAGGRPTRDAAQAGLDAIDNDVTWIPAWGRDRMYNMLANRPDWCISRQRAWGVPIPAVDCAKCGEALLTGDARRARRVGVRRVQRRRVVRAADRGVLPAGLDCPSCGGTAFERERDILDVWFDSGSSHEAVLPFRPELTWPADMYLEGSDQHRGWFQSSLLGWWDGSVSAERDEILGSLLDVGRVEMMRKAVEADERAGRRGPAPQEIAPLHGNLRRDRAATRHGRAFVRVLSRQRRTSNQTNAISPTPVIARRTQICGTR